MILKNFRTRFVNQLSDIYPKTEVDTFFFLLIEEYLDLQRIDVSLQPYFEINEEKITLLESAIQRLQKQEPLQYITGNTEFYGLPFNVNKNVLIPRPETEELIEWILKEAPKLKNSKIEKSLSILDIGTGSGCIPIALKKQVPNADVSAIDISEEALKVAAVNAKLNNVEINFIEQDILNTNNLTSVFASETKQSVPNTEITSSLAPRNDVKFDIIISNPPYVRELEKEEIKNNVLNNEPHLALFVKDNNPLLFYDKIADLAKAHLNKGGLLFFEINQYLGKETVDLLKGKGFKNIELRKDLFGNDRMILAHK